jgi:hypothetical protein
MRVGIAIRRREKLELSAAEIARHLRLNTSSIQSRIREPEKAIRDHEM